MSDITSTSGLLFNTLFLRALIILPTILIGYILMICFKQYKSKFKNKPLIENIPNN